MYSYKLYMNTQLNIHCLTSNQKDTLMPIRGMLLYNTTVDELQCYDGAKWIQISSNPAIYTKEMLIDSIRKIYNCKSN